MAVIPLEENQSVFGSRSQFRLNGRAIVIENLDNDQLFQENEANATYDLRVGKEYRYLHLPRKASFRDEKDEIILERGQSILLETFESINLPRSVFGVVITKVSMVQLGVSNDASKVDPGYRGQLIVTITNFGPQPVYLKYGQKFCSIFFLRMEHDAQAYDKSSKRIQDLPSDVTKKSLEDIVTDQRARIRSLSTVVLILSIIEILRLGIWLFQSYWL